MNLFLLLIFKSMMLQIMPSTMFFQFDQGSDGKSQKKTNFVFSMCKHRECQNHT